MHSRPVCLTIAGSDSGGGAGIQADLKTFGALGVFGTSALTCLTAQNPKSVQAVVESSPEFLESQLNTLIQYFPIASAKTGMLFSETLIRVVIAFFQKNSQIPLVVDPVMVATSGAKLLQDSAISILIEKLIPLATVVTPNLDEAEILLGRKIQSVDEMKEGAKEFFEKKKVPILMKGGHLHSEELTDVLFDGKDFTIWKFPKVVHVHTHGTGCTYSSAIASELAKGNNLAVAIGNARTYLQKAIQQSYLTGEFSSINHYPI